ncbi:hypothetical protein NUSPORA_00419 [Nucleospora cyclopteri]
MIFINLIKVISAISIVGKQVDKTVVKDKTKLKITLKSSPVITRGNIVFIRCDENRVGAQNKLYVLRQLRINLLDVLNLEKSTFEQNKSQNLILLEFIDLKNFFIKMKVIFNNDPSKIFHQISECNAFFVEFFLKDNSFLITPLFTFDDQMNLFLETQVDKTSFDLKKSIYKEYNKVFSYEKRYSKFRMSILALAFVLMAIGFSIIFISNYISKITKFKY